MKVLFCGDSPTVSTGFARCTKAACDALSAAGHEVHVLGLHYFGDPHEHPYSIYSTYQPFDGGVDWSGCERLPRLAKRLGPDLIVILNDPWNVPGYTHPLHRAGLGEIPVVAWLAVDGKNQKGGDLAGLEHVIVWTRWAGEELERGGYGGPWSVVPLGVDHGVFRPMDRGEARAITLPPEVPRDAYIVGVLGRNQPRKRLDLTLEYFTRWLRESGRENAYLYLHVAPTGERGADLQQLVRYHGPETRVLWAPAPVGRGAPDTWIRAYYASLDCYWTTTQGEGWGLPCLEAMACGVPCVVPDWSALGDWPGDAVLKVPCTATALTAPINGNPWTIGGIADPAATVEALELVASSPTVREALRVKGLARAAELSWQRTGDEMVAALESLIPETRTAEEVA